MKRFLLTAAIVSSGWTASTASAQYFGPRFGFPGRAAFALPFGPPIVLPPAPMAYRYGPPIGAIARWSRFPPVSPVLPAYPVASYVPRPLSVDISPNRIDIRTPGFEYRAERHLVPQSATDFMPLPIHPGTGSLSEAAYRLAAALSARPDGEVWLDYLQPERIARSADPGELAELSPRYQGVMANPDLAWLAKEDGFREILGQLSGMSQEPASSSIQTPIPAPANEQKPRPVQTPTNEVPREEAPVEKASQAEELPAPKAEPTTSV